MPPASCGRSGCGCKQPCGGLPPWLARILMSKGGEHVANQRQQDASVQGKIPKVTSARPAGGEGMTDAGTKVARQGARGVNEVPNQQEQLTQD